MHAERCSTQWASPRGASLLVAVGGVAAKVHIAKNGIYNAGDNTAVIAAPSKSWQILRD